MKTKLLILSAVALLGSSAVALADPSSSSQPSATNYANPWKVTNYNNFSFNNFSGKEETIVISVDIGVIQIATSNTGNPCNGKVADNQGLSCVLQPNDSITFKDELKDYSSSGVTIVRATGTYQIINN